ncbi:hypothetical protein Pint_12550 [Pistacia integerrima]|uniref:Uncharacterized protein n=1 Tax=Pistacia integerrima TaxID=434235 RepID=A0ACC0YC80_9ROSI|nr:hypothetical protein Pint_12550 [Pistacia integerrima]
MQKYWTQLAQGPPPEILILPWPAIPSTLLFLFFQHLTAREILDQLV